MVIRGNRAMRLLGLYQFSEQFLVGWLSLLNEKFSDANLLPLDPYSPQSSFFSQQRLTFGPLVCRQNVLRFVLQDAPDHFELDVHLFTQLFHGIAPRRR